MIVINPIAVNDASLVSSDVPETDYTEWDAVTTWTLGQRVTVSTVEPNIHRNYELLAGSSTNEPPWLDDGTTWLDLGATNTWAMFDEIVGTRTEQADSIEVEIAAGLLINAVALLNVDAATIRVVVDDPVAGVVYDRTEPLQSDSGITDWYAYFLTPIQQEVDKVFMDLPAYATATTRITIEKTGDVAAVGVLSVGLQRSIGTAQYGTGIGIIDYSRKAADSFGNAVVQQRAFSKRADYIVKLEPGRVADVQNFLSSIRAAPVVWVGNENFGSTIIYGYFRDFDIVLSDPVQADCNIVVEGLT